MPHFDSETASWRPGLRARRRVPVRPADLRDLRRLLGNRLLGGKSGRQPDLSGVEHDAQVRGVEHAHRPAMGGHDRPLRRRRGRRQRAESQAGASCRWSVAPAWSGCCSTTTSSTSSPCSPTPWSSARARGCSSTPAGPGARAGRVARHRQRGDDAGPHGTAARSTGGGHSRHDVRDIEHLVEGAGRPPTGTAAARRFPADPGRNGPEPLFVGLPDVNLELPGTDVLDGCIVTLEYRPANANPTAEPRR